MSFKEYVEKIEKEIEERNESFKKYDHLAGIENRSLFKSEPNKKYRVSICLRGVEIGSHEVPHENQGYGIPYKNQGHGDTIRLTIEDAKELSEFIIEKLK